MLDSSLCVRLVLRFRISTKVVISSGLSLKLEKLNKIVAKILAGLMALIAGTSPSAHGQVWNEVGDTGELPGTAQIPVGVGPLTTITGTRGPDADMYLINIPDPAAGLNAEDWNVAKCVSIKAFTEKGAKR